MDSPLRWMICSQCERVLLMTTPAFVPYAVAHHRVDAIVKTNSAYVHYSDEGDAVPEIDALDHDTEIDEDAIIFESHQQARASR